MASAEALQAQLADKTKQYESKIAALQAINSALQKENDKLRKQAARDDDSDADYEEELEELRAEFQERLGASDRLIAQLQDEKARLTASLAAANAGGNAAETRVADLESHVDSLKAEGEALSRKAGDLEASCRKLRSTNKDLETERDKLQARVKSLEAQLLELQEKAELAAHQAAQQAEDLERELSEARADAKRQVAEARREANDMQLRLEEEAARGGAELVAASREREATLAAQVLDLREALTSAERDAATQEDAHRRKVQQLEESIRSLEAQRDEMASCAGDATRPLLKQIESMAATAAAAADAATAAEDQLQRRLQAAEDAVAAASAAERAAAGRAATAEAALAAARDAAAAASADAAETRARLEAAQRGYRTVEAEKESLEERLGAAAVREERLRAETDQQRRDLSERLWDAEQRVRVLTVERDTLLQRVETFANGTSTNRPPDTPHNTNPNNISSHTSTSSRGHSSPGGGAAAAAAAASSSSGGAAAAAAAADAADVPTISDADLQELDTLLEGFSETAAAVAAEQQRLKAQRAGGAGGGGGGGLLNGFFRPQQSEVKVNTAALIRAVELLQQRVRAAERARDLAAEQLFSAYQSQDATRKDLQAAQDARRDVAEVSRRLDLALELLGERNERIEQLEEDIEDMRGIFKAQLEEAVNQLQHANAELARLRHGQQGPGSSNSSQQPAENGSQPHGNGSGETEKRAAAHGKHRGPGKGSRGSAG